MIWPWIPLVIALLTGTWSNVLWLIGTLIALGLLAFGLAHRLRRYIDECLRAQDRLTGIPDRRK